MTIHHSTVSTANGSRVLIAGPLGFIGRFITGASLASGRPTFLLVRSSSGCPSKSKAVKYFQDRAAIILFGMINDKEFVEKTLKENKIDVVISAVGGKEILDQLPLVEAINAVGTVKRFLPSEFGHDVDRADPVEPGLTMYNHKRLVRRLIEKYDVPYTYICCNSIASWPYHNNKHPSEVIPPLDQFEIYGDGSVKAYFIAGTDIGKFTMKTVDDIRTLNKSVHFRPSCNFYNMNELASLWERKIGRTLPRVTVTEENLIAAAAENRIPQSVVASFTHDIFIRGCQSNFSVDGSADLEVCKLYPDEPFRTLDECFEDFLVKAKLEGPSGTRNNENTNTNPVGDSLPVSNLGLTWICCNVSAFYSISDV
ncbi:leucoanthocyanidin reductase 1 [Tripterygium wilfordii]|uniref:Leucoanthocyanidin reductase 1 n=1 Tax=Tripterygium wilfordii TaxID=458696 RepID=A0A7J7E023_TRIWF|nr:leucoanthocyanidin reductase-like [Tripterygium wilfordii]KAF5751948.1 leucoanthocyanidin reductase 1 [Tripterygium wilfordii]